jgi:hypothetical protein
MVINQPSLHRSWITAQSQCRIEIGTFEVQVWMEVRGVVHGEDR